jgi:gas vesicle protein
MDPNQHNNNKNVLGVAFAGLIMGAVAGILLAPKSGKETRADLAKLGERMRDDITDKLGKLTTFTRETYKEVVDTVVNKYQEAKEVTTEEAQALKEELDRNYDQVKQSIDEEKNAQPKNIDTIDSAS